MAEYTRDELADLNLLFAFLALQLNFVDRDQLLQAMSIWVNDKSRPLGEILIEKEFLTKERHAMLQTLVQEYLRENDNDAEKSLTAVNTVTMSLAAVREALCHVGDEDIENSLARISRSASQVDVLTTMQMPTLPDSSGTTRFRVLRPHARGGLGQISVAMDDELNREVALKEIQDQFADDQMSRGRFVLEAEITGGLEHPGIVPVYGMGTYPDGRPYYAMRFIRGDSLKDAISRFHKARRNKRAPGQRTLEFRKLLRRFIDVCYALEYAHSRQVLHRDIKPGNIMLGRYGETMLVDWGMAKVVDVSDEELTLGIDQRRISPSIGKDFVATSMGSTVGTPPYMSPEQAAGRLDRLGPVSDIYGLGATFFHLLTGRPPFRDKDVGSVLKRVREGDFEPPRKIDKSVPKPLEAICLKAMALGEEQRYQSANEFAEDIEHWLADEPVSVFQESLLQKSARWFRQHKAWAQATAASLVLVSIVSLFALISVQRALQRETIAKVDEAEAKEEAVRQRDFAIQRLRDARTTVDKFVTGAAESLQYHWMYADVRKQFLQLAVDEYAKLTEQQVDLPNLEIERGRAFQRLGQAERRLGHTLAAVDAYQSAVGIFRRYTEDSAAKLEIAHTHNMMGLVQADQNQQIQAEKSYRFAIEHLQPIVKSYPDSLEFSSALGDVYHNLGLLQLHAGDLSAAEGSLREAVVELSPLLSQNLGQNEYAISLGKARLVLGRILLLQGQYASALEQFDFAQQVGETILKESVDLATVVEGSEQRVSLVEAENENLDAREVVATASLERAAVLGKVGKFQDQLMAFEVAIQGYQALSNNLRHMRPYKENLSAALYNQGWALYRLGRTREAEMALREASIYYDHLARIFELPKFVEHKGVTIDATGRMFSDQGKDEDAARIHQTATQVFADLATANPDVPRYVERRSIAEANLGHVLHKLGQLDLALDHFQAAVTALEPLMGSQPERPELSDTLAVVYKQLGMLHLTNGDEKGALAAFEKAKHHWQEITGSEKESAAEHLNHFARFLLTCPLESVRDPVVARQLGRRAHDSAPQNAFYCTTLGIVDYRTGEWPTAIAWLQKTIALRENESQATELFFLAMTLWQQAAGPNNDAEQYYQQALQWTTQHRPGNLDLGRVRDEAQRVREQFSVSEVSESADPTVE